MLGFVPQPNLHGLELGGVEAGVDAVLGEELGVGAALGDAAAVEDEDLVRLEDGAEAVGDDDAGAVREDALEGLLDEAFGFAVETAGGFIEDEDARVAQDDAGEGDALFFTAAEAVAALADDGVVAIGEAGDEAVDVGGAGGLLDLFLGGIGAGEADVDGDGIVEEEGLLGDHADVGGEGSEGEVTQVDAIETDAALLGVIEARNEVGEGGLTGAAGADEGGELAGLDGEIDILEGDRAGLAGIAGFRFGLFAFTAAGEDAFIFLNLAKAAHIAEPAGFVVFVAEADVVEDDPAFDV